MNSITDIGIYWETEATILVKAEEVRRKEEDALLVQIQGGDTRLREKFLKSKMGFLRACAWKFQKKWVELDDLIQVGWIAVNNIIDRYEIGSAPFNTFAVPWIHGSMQEAIRKEIWSQTNASRTFPEIQKTYRRLVQLHFGRKPTIEDLMRETGFSREVITNYTISNFPIRIDRIDERGIGFKRWIETLTMEKPDIAGLSQRVVVSKLHTILWDAKLTPDELLVIERYYGLHWHQEKFLHEIWDEMRKSESRISQIRKQALEKMAAVVRRNGLDFYD